MDKSEHINELASALVKFQAEVRDAERTKSSYNGKYAELEQIYSIIRPLLSKHGICFKQDLVSQIAGEVKVRTWLIHISGQYMVSELTVSVPAGQGKTNSLQQVGVAASYARRYAIMGAVGITQRDEDDDADSLTEETPKFKQAEHKAPAPTKKETTISHDQALVLLDLIKQSDSTEQKIHQFYKVQKLLDLTNSQYENCKMLLAKKIADKEVAK